MQSTPLGMRAPRAVNLQGSFKNSTISCSSSFASSQPATSLKVTLLRSLVSSFAGDLPKFMALAANAFHLAGEDEIEQEAR